MAGWARHEDITEREQLRKQRDEMARASNAGLPSRRQSLRFRERMDKLLGGWVRALMQ